MFHVTIIMSLLFIDYYQLNTYMLVPVVSSNWPYLFNGSDF